MALEVGKTYVFFVPPGWILGGTISEIDAKTVTLVDACYLENAGEGQTLIGSVAAATTPAQLTAACPTSWPIPDGTMLPIEPLLIRVPCARDLTPLSRAKAADALRRSR